MKLINLLNVALACVAGFVGGALASRSSVQAAPPTVVRASRFELLDTAGHSVARWEIDPERKGVHMCFLDRGITTLDLGALPHAGPFLWINGRDGKRRFSVSLDPSGKPGLSMSDERWLGRVVLGYIGTDTPDIPDTSDDWGLGFRPFGTTRSAAYMGMTNVQGGETRGVLFVNGEKVR